MGSARVLVLHIGSMSLGLTRNMDRSSYVSAPLSFSLALTCPLFVLSLSVMQV